ncbi:MAG: TRAM domain-containing protein, partial [Patescibacteria group bacterium]|nr:TRAM domain-containing protein [Patescibacteria group bacterium]
MTRMYKGRLITCDFNLEKKASVSGVVAINMHHLANKLKITAVPGESLHVKIQHIGKDPTQGVGYLDDGTMIVVENGNHDLDHFVNVVVSRVIQTSSGRMLFAKKI